MRTRGKSRFGAAACAAALVVLLAACSGSSDTDDTKASAKPTPTPTATTPSVAPQPDGAHGVTFKIRNWDEYADDPVVLAYKQAYEGAIASANDKKIYPEFRAGYTKKGLRDQLPGIKQAWPDDWSAPSEALVVVDKVSANGNKARIVACVWGETVDYRYSSGKFISPGDTRQWYRRIATLVKSGSSWKIDTRTVKGSCDLEEPS